MLTLGKQVFRKYPTEEQIKTFVDNCFNSDNPFANVDKTNYELKILELEINEGRRKTILS